MSTRRTRCVLHGCGHFIPLEELCHQDCGDSWKRNAASITNTQEKTGKTWLISHSRVCSWLDLGSSVAQCRGWAPNSGIAALQMKTVRLERGHNAVFLKTLNAESGPCHNRRACLNMCCSRYGNKGITKATHCTATKDEAWSRLCIGKELTDSPWFPLFLSNMSHNSMSGHTKICRKRRLKKPMSCQWLAKNLCSTEPTPF